jgi:hypothetical protein
VWSALSCLTHLSLNARLLADDAAALEGINCLEQLQELSFLDLETHTITPAVVSGLQSLSRLELVFGGKLQPAALACINTCGWWIQLCSRAAQQRCWRSSPACSS